MQTHKKEKKDISEVVSGARAREDSLLFYARCEKPTLTCFATCHSSHMQTQLSATLPLSTKKTNKNQICAHDDQGGSITPPYQFLNYKSLLHAAVGAEIQNNRLIIRSLKIAIFVFTLTCGRQWLPLSAQITCSVDGATLAARVGGGEFLEDDEMRRNIPPAITQTVLPSSSSATLGIKIIIIIIVIVWMFVQLSFRHPSPHAKPEFLLVFYLYTLLLCATAIFRCRLSHLFTNERKDRRTDEQTEHLSQCLQSIEVQKSQSPLFSYKLRRVSVL